MAKLVRDTRGRVLTDSLGRKLSSEPPHKFNIEVVKAVSKSVKKPSYSTLLHLDNMISALKAEGIWQKLDTFVNFAYNNTNNDSFSFYDFKRDVFYTGFGGLSYTDYGYEGNGVDAYIDTNFNPAIAGNNYKLNDASRGAVVCYTISTSLPQYVTIDGVSLQNNLQNMYNMTQTAQRINQGTNILNQSVDLSGLGLKCINRTDNINVNLVNKSTLFSRTANSTEILSSNQILLRRHTVDYSYIGLSMYFMGASFDYTETQLFRQYYNEYLTNIGLDPIA